jgi:hypothetical protein
MTFLNARSNAPGVSSASTSRAMSMKRRDCSVLSALAGGSGVRFGMAGLYRELLGVLHIFPPADRVLCWSHAAMPYGARGAINQ